MFSGARATGGFSPVAEAGLWVDMRAKPDSAASLDRAARIRPLSPRKHKPSQTGDGLPRSVQEHCSGDQRGR